MKLNLLPTYVSKEKSAKAAWFLAIVIAVASIFAAVFLRISSQDALQKAKDEAAQYTTRHQQALQASRDADTIIAQATQVITNIDLAQAMIRHNAVYPDLYDQIRAYVPGFFRVTAMSASPGGSANCTVTLQGVLRTHQEYADLMLALLRIPGAQAVSRSGYTIIDPFVPPLNEVDQTGRPIRPGESNIPDDPMERLNALMSRGGLEGFTGVGGFGTETTEPKGAMPDWSQVTVSVVLPLNIQTPDPRATLAAVRSTAPQSPGTSPAPGGLPAPGGGPQSAPMAPAATGGPRPGTG